MIILEGPDGAGKTTLLLELKAHFQFEQAPRGVGSDGHRLVDLRDYVEEHLELGRRKAIYDRFALISGPIYGSTKGMSTPNHPFADLQWLSYQEFRLHEVRPLIIYCLPPMEVVRANVYDDPESYKVAGPWIENIYWQYLARAARDQAAGMATTYDYTIPANYDAIVERISRYIWEA